jgi:lysophospholipase L1-like esterase
MIAVNGFSFEENEMKKRLLAGTLLLFAAAVFGQDWTIRVACIGNSITIGSGGSTAWPQQLGQRLGPHYNVRNFGVSGTTMLRHGDFPYWNEAAFLQAQDFDPHIVIITLGTNDSKPQNRVFLNEMFDDYMEFIKVLRKDGRDPQIYVARPCPVFGAEGASGINGTVLHEQIEPLVDSVRTAAGGFMIDWYRAMLSHSDLFPDGIHPSTIGYAMMADTAAWYLNNSPSGVIRLFAATDTEVEVGEKTRLYWEATPGSQVTLDGVPVGLIDSLEAAPTQRTTYTLIATGAVADTKRVVIDNIPPGRIKSFGAFPLQLDEGAADTSIISWVTTSGSQVTLDGLSVAQNGSQAVIPDKTTTYTLEVTGGESQSAQVTIEVLPSNIINRALRHAVTVSSTLRGSASDWAVDGDSTTAWQSAGKNTEWIMVDFGRMLALSTLRIRWGSDFASSYAIHFLDGAGKAVKAITQTKGDGGLDEITGIATQARYARLLCQKISGSYYSVKELEVYGTTVPSGVASNEQQPAVFALEQNYPNPFNPATTIAYTLTRRTAVTLLIYDLQGRLVRLADSGIRGEGRHELLFDAAGLSSGLYLYELRAGQEKWTKQMLLIK